MTMPRPDWHTERQERAAIAVGNYCRAVYENAEAGVIEELLQRCLRLGGDPRGLSPDERLFFLAVIEKVTVSGGDSEDEDGEGGS